MMGTVIGPTTMGIAIGPMSNPPAVNPKLRRPPRRKPRPSVTVVEAEVVERSPRRPIILDAELIQDEDD